MSSQFNIKYNIICAIIFIKGRNKNGVYFRNKWKQYKDFKALNGLTMHVPKGSIYGFVGKNGAGKTTLIRLISGLQMPTSGDFKIYGINYKDSGINSARKKMGAVVETPSIFLVISFAAVST